MMKNKFLKLGVISIAVIAVTVTLGLTALKGQANNDLKVITVQKDHLVYDSVKELADDVDLIILGEPINDITQDEGVINYYTGAHANPERKSISSFFTLRDIKVHKVLKGSVPDDMMKIGEGVAIVEGTNGKELLISSDYSMAQKGNKYLFFLKKGYTGDYFIMATNQGKFNVDGKDAGEIQKYKEETDPQIFRLKKEVLETYSKDIK